MALWSKEHGGSKQRNLIAVYQDSQVMKDKEGNVKGAFLDIQIDQRDKTKADLKAGKIDTNPSLHSESKKGKDGNNFVSHTVFYTKNQLDQFGPQVKQEDGRTALAFKADITRSKDAKTGKERVVVYTQKDPALAKNDADKAKIEAYNEQHPVGPSDRGINAKSMARQERITAEAKANKPERITSKSAEAEAGKEEQLDAGMELG